MANNKLFKLIFTCLIIFSLSLNGQVRLPRLVSDGMVIQRDSMTKVWGWATPGEKITVQFLNSTYTTKADSEGNWDVLLVGLKAGGPHKMIIKASNVIEISDILIGDVWLCSGQSNIELPMRRVSWIYEDEIKQCENSFIRQFKVPQAYDFNQQHNDLVSGSWKAANAENIMDFSAVAYFYAKEIYARYKVPVGILNASLGGSPAEAWMSEEALKKFPMHYNEMRQFKDSALISQIINSDNTRISEWYTQLNQKDEGYKGKTNFKDQFDDNPSEWKTIQVPDYWSGTELENIDGVVWYKRKFEIKKAMAEKPAMLILGRIVDADSVFINGEFIGTTSYQYPPRRYNIPSGILKKGENTIAVRVINNIGIGGFVPDKSYEIVSENGIVDLKGDWNYKIGAVMEPLASQTFIRWKPGGLYNSMIVPLKNYQTKGVLWYQGESNTQRPLEYAKLLPALIKDWRDNFKHTDLPFIIVQLPNFMESKDIPTESNWALFREAQLKTLKVPNTALVVAIDLGEWNDIHPLNKKDVGYRLSLAAKCVAYGDDKSVCSGPIFDSINIVDNEVFISFTNVGGGLVFKNGNSLKQFAIAGVDKKFVWANAKISDNKVIVWSEEVPEPIAVRYAWEDNPKNASLYNKEGLPASPFRNDKWTGTEK